jgi:archaellum component FlaC
MTDIERLRTSVSRLFDLAEEIERALNDVEANTQRDKDTIERLEEEVADLTTEIEEARQGRSNA